MKTYKGDDIQAFHFGFEGPEPWSIQSHIQTVTNQQDQHTFILKSQLTGQLSPE